MAEKTLLRKVEEELKCSICLGTYTDPKLLQCFHVYMSVDTRGNGQLQFWEPYDISFNSINNKVYVVDNCNHRIQVLNSNFTFWTTIGKHGSDKGQFHHPSAIACDSAGNVYVADSANHRVQVFTAKGKFLRMFGRCHCGRNRGELHWPTGIALHPNTNMVYVSELYYNRVSVFTREG